MRMAPIPPTAPNVTHPITCGHTEVTVATVTVMTVTVATVTVTEKVVTETPVVMGFITTVTVAMLGYSYCTRRKRACSLSVLCVAGVTPSTLLTVSEPAASSDGPDFVESEPPPGTIAGRTLSVTSAVVTGTVVAESVVTSAVVTGTVVAESVVMSPSAQ
jgi:hypothetical protein